MKTATATYSPEDNKLRLYFATRLPQEDYEVVRGAGYIWAAQQECFVAPAWTPEREDIALRYADEIEDEDKSLSERAGERSERFKGYEGNRREDAEAARHAVSVIADSIPLGQPIIVGHHSEARARRDAERIRNGMRRAIRNWETAEYWKYRAARAIAAAKYKERPDVRARRIKRLEADLRLQVKAVKEHAMWLRLWTGEGKLRKPSGEEATLMETAIWILNRTWNAGISCRDIEDGKVSPEEARDKAVASLNAAIARAKRWASHYEHRLAYERAMLAADGGTAADKFDLQVGGRILYEQKWLPILRVNKSGGRVNSVTVAGNWRPVGVEEFEDYRPPTEEDAAKARKATRLPPLCNYPGKVPWRKNGGEICFYDTREITQEEWNKKPSDYKRTKVAPATETNGEHRVRWCMGPGCTYTPVFIVDAKRTDPPKSEQGEARPRLDVIPAAPIDKPSQIVKEEAQPGDDHFKAMKQSLKAGVQVVAAPQLFPTPPELAKRMVEEAGIRPGDRILEPSAGTGRLLEAMPGGPSSVVAVEINGKLVEGLRRTFAACDIRQADFLECSGDLGLFDRIVMNPPFRHAEDVRHIQHAYGFLKPGGRLVALCANGPRQQAALQLWAENLGGRYEQLPNGSFEAEGTMVEVALVVVEKPEA